VLDRVEFAGRGIGHRHRISEIVAGGYGEVRLQVRDPSANRARSFVE
jgi:hypothetical protein